jgi:NADH dehydrogenase/NADH:ubiquinone oxidoreductase subunit G
VASNLLTLTINGRKRKAQAGQSLLDAARQHGIKIPTLCHHEALEPVGSCRLCVVEVSLGGRTRIMASCVTPVEAGMAVRTDTPRILEIRRTIASLLLARCPTIEIIKRTARELGVKSTPFPKDKEDCFLCGMCIRACAEIAGVGAIGFANRGPKSRVEPPFGQESNVCIGCGTCTTICPARTFDLTRVFARRSMHKGAGGKDTPRCTVCEDHYSGT